MELRELRKKPHLSSSSIGDYCECSLLYKFGRVDKLPMEYKSDAMEYGSVIHLVLGEYYLGKMTGTKISLKALLDCFEIHWRETAEGNEDIQYSKGKDFETLLRQGKELISVWYSKIDDDDFNVIEERDGAES